MKPNQIFFYENLFKTKNKDFRLEMALNIPNFSKSEFYNKKIDYPYKSSAYITFVLHILTDTGYQLKQEFGKHFVYFAFYNFCRKRT